MAGDSKNCIECGRLQESIANLKTWKDDTNKGQIAMWDKINAKLSIRWAWTVTIIMIGAIGSVWAVQWTEQKASAKAQWQAITTQSKQLHEIDKNVALIAQKMQ